MTVEIIHGDAVDHLPRFAGQAALIYCDPLFNTGQTFRTRDHEVALRTAVGGLIADATSDRGAALPFPVREELAAHARAAWDEALARLGRRK